MSENLFQYDKAYTKKEICELSSKVTYFDKYLIADSPEIEYWFKLQDREWYLGHTWGHFIVGRPKK